MIDPSQSQLGARSAPIYLLLLVLTNWGCSSDPPAGSDISDESVRDAIEADVDADDQSDRGADRDTGVDDADLPCPEINHLTVHGQRVVLGGGVQIWLQAEDANRVPIPAEEYVHCLTVASEQHGEVAFESHPRSFWGGHTLVLATPGIDAEQNAEMIAAIDEFISGLPENEEIAVYRWSAEVLQVVGFTRDLDEIRQRLAAAFPPSEDEPLELLAAFDDATDELRDVRRHTAIRSRTVAVFAPGAAIDARPDPKENQLNIWLIGQDNTDSLGAEPRTFVFESAGDQDLEDNIAAARQLVHGYRTASPAVVGLCPASPGDDIEITPSESPLRSVDLTLDEPRPEQDTDQCDPVAVAEWEYDETTRIDFFMTPEQREIYEQRVADQVYDDFALSIRVSPDANPVEAVAHLRGQSSLGCERKSYTIDLAGGARHILPDTATDEFYLISMCLDEGYVNQITADNLMRMLGLFDLQFDLVELVVDDVSAGVYLFMEKPRETFELTNSRLRAVIRRDHDTNDRAPAVKFSAEDDDWALENYNNLLELLDTREGESLRDYLSDRMDFEQYMRWVALMTLLGNGDYVDEVFFISNETIRQGLAADYYSIVGWDPDDLFSACHWGGRFAIVDPHSLLYCAESILDHATFTDPVVYAWYVEILEDVIAAMTQEVFDSAVDETVGRLLPFFEEQRIRDAMIELLESHPDASDAEPARQAIQSAGDELKALFSARRAELLESIQAYRDSL